jgi:hypothetical protein
MGLSTAAQMLVNKTSAEATMSWLTSRYQQIRQSSPQGFETVSDEVSQQLFSVPP